MTKESPVPGITWEQYVELVNQFFLARVELIVDEAEAKWAETHGEAAAA